MGCLTMHMPCLCIVEQRAGGGTPRSRPLGSMSAAGSLVSARTRGRVQDALHRDRACSDLEFDNHAPVADS